MEIIEVKQDKKVYIDLLLLADEQEDMVDRYLERGTMYVLVDNYEMKTVCVVTDEGDFILEIKNIAVRPEDQHKGYGTKLIEFIEEKYRDLFHVLKVGMEGSPLTIPFYERCGFKESYRVKDFFIENYDHPIFECGKQLIDMIYFEKLL